MDRRDFIKLTAVTGTTATLAGCGNPEHQIIRFVPDDDLVPGVAEWKPSVCPLCSAGCGVTARVMEADVETVRNGQSGVVKMGVAKKLEGQPDSPINHGGLCARGQAAIQITYHPDRLTQPMKRSGARGSGDFKPVSWDEAIAELVSRMDALAAAGDQKALAYVARPRPSRRMVLAAEFMVGFGAPAPYGFEPFDDTVLRLANAMSWAKEQLATVDLARARFVISFGADFLGTWNSPVAQSVGYGAMRQARPGVRGAFVQVESRMSLTGASADQWIPVKPGTEGVLALGLAHVILANKLRPATTGSVAASIAGWSNGLSDYTPARVEQITGVAAKRVERLARELTDVSPAVAIVGGAPLAQTNAMFTALAVNALSELLGAANAPGGLYFTPGRDTAHPAAFTADAFNRAKVVLLDNANPIYGMPKATKVREALEKVPFIASFGSFVDDTSVHADLILPDNSFLESWVDSAPESGSIEAVTIVAGPVMKPLHNTRSTVDVLTAVARRAARAAADESTAYDGAVRRALFRRRSVAVSAALPAVPVVAIRRWVGGAPAVAAGDAGSADLGDVEQLDRAQSADGGAAAHCAGRSRRGHFPARESARSSDDLSGDCARPGRDAGGQRPRDVHAVCEQARREPDRDPCATDGRSDRFAGVGCDPCQNRTRGRQRRQFDHVRGRDARASTRARN